jgi:hypothetical protein
VTPDEFRSLALDLPAAWEHAHMGHPDFRVGKKIFASLWADGVWGMVKLSPEEQAAFTQDAPEVFQPVKGAWGVRGCTQVRLAAATKGVVRPALAAAWRNTAPKRIVKQYGGYPS